MAKGYTLIELVVAVGLFALVMTLASGSYLLMIDLSQQAQGVSTGIDSLSFALESMTRNIRTGTFYSCGAFGGDCPGGADSISFKDSSGTDITYTRGFQGADASIGDIVENGTTVLTDPSVSVSSLMFYVTGTETLASGDYAQPYVTIIISGTVSSGPRGTPRAFTIETGSAMRGIDLTVALPPVENPSSPTCTLVAEPASILSGGSSVLTWTALGASQFSVNGVEVSPPAGGTYSVGPLSVTTTFTGTATNDAGSGTCNAQVVVGEAPVNGACGAAHFDCTSGDSVDQQGGSSSWTWSCTGANGGLPASCIEYRDAPTASLSASPANPVPYGTQVQLTWNSGNADSCTATGWTYNGSLSGSAFTAPLTSDASFTFQCSGNGQTSSLQSVSVTVSPESVNGACAATHYNCISTEPSTDNIDTPDQYTWTCPESNGGIPALCSETKPGIAWTSRTAQNGIWNSVTHANNLFVAVGSASGPNDAMTSPDGITWTSRTAPNGTWNSVTYGNGLFVAVGDSGGVMTSPDGITWTSRTAPNGTWNSVTYANGLFVAVGSASGSSDVITSP